ncbi:hypothetical protein CSOJ01_13579 [Colletotrichum sojae]|uniref:Uncharacterized protein n=1 Tax=Colletotrichum sojae TaxID=2175907 RepID=A0A8H6ISW3_9PEZI|nr:hypothetical protein CSOJ01_13579 [Colletotrichum sojae]
MAGTITSGKKKSMSQSSPILHRPERAKTAESRAFLGDIQSSTSKRRSPPSRTWFNLPTPTPARFYRPYAIVDAACLLQLLDVRRRRRVSNAALSENLRREFALGDDRLFILGEGELLDLSASLSTMASNRRRHHLVVLHYLTAWYCFVFRLGLPKATPLYVNMHGVTIPLRTDAANSQIMDLSILQRPATSPPLSGVIFVRDDLAPYNTARI